MKSIRLHEKFGLAPTMLVCFLCGKEKGEIALLGAAWHVDRRNGVEKEPPMRMCIDKNPCKECESLMEKGVILISVMDNEKHTDNPYRTGGWVLISDEAAERAFGADSEIYKKRVAFVEDGYWKKLGLPNQHFEKKEALYGE